MKVLLYSRTSPDDPLCIQQDASLRTWCATNHHEVVGVYHEQVSGPSENRPILQGMFVDILKNKIEAVVVTDIQKLMYSTKDAAKVFKMLNELGTSVIVVEQGLEYDQAFMGMYPQFIRLEHLLIGNQMREGRAAAKAKGVKFGRSRTPMSEETLKIITTMDKAGRSVRDITAATGISEGVVMGRLQELKKKED